MPNSPMKAQKSKQAIKFKDGRGEGTVCCNSGRFKELDDKMKASKHLKFHASKSSISACRAMETGIISTFGDRSTPEAGAMTSTHSNLRSSPDRAAGLQHHPILVQTANGFARPPESIPGIDSISPYPFVCKLWLLMNELLSVLHVSSQSSDVRVSPRRRL